MPLRILLVDDSSLMRLLVADILNSEPDLNVIDTASNGLEAVEKAKSLTPDVVVLDLVMKDYDGLYAIKRLMEEHPVPIIVLSSFNSVNPEAAVEALKAGAYDFVAKPQSALLNAKVRDVQHELVYKIKLAANANTQQLKSRIQHENNFQHTFDTKSLPYHVVVIGASTGGTGAIEDILKKIPANFPLPILIAQHIPPEFAYSFAKRLNELSPLQVKVAQEKESVQAGTIYIMPSHTNVIVKSIENQVRIYFTNQIFSEYNNPSIDGLMQSVADVYNEKAIGILLTGMGRDGAAGMKKLAEKRAFTIAQDEKTSVVFGMPKAAIENGSVQKILPIQEIAPFVVACLG